MMNYEENAELTLDGMVANKTMRSMMCQNIIQNAKQYVNGQLIADVDIRLLNVHPKYQRCQLQHAMKIADKFDVNKVGTLVISYRKDHGYFNVVDGQHRTMAARMKGLQYLTCIILQNMTISQEAKLFAGQVDLVKRISPFDEFHASLAIADSDDTWISKTDKQIKKICDERSIEVKPGSGCNKLKSITEARAIIKRGGISAFEWVLDILCWAGWNCYKNSFGKDIMESIYHFYTGTKGDEETKSLLVEFLRDSNPDEIIALGNNQYPNLGNLHRIIRILSDVVI